MKRLSIFLLVLVMLLSFGGCFGQEQPDKAPLLIQSNGKEWEPYVNFLWAESRSENGWVAADGIRISNQFSNLSEKIPEIPYGSDFTLRYRDKVSLLSISVYDADGKLIQQNTKEEIWKSLAPGTYYLVVTVQVQGNYILADEKHEYTGLECACKLVIPAVS